MNKKIFLMLAFLLVLPLIHAEEVTGSTVRPALDMYFLFVEVIAGNIIIAGFIIALLMAGILAFGRVSQPSLITIILTFLTVYGMGLFGAIIAIPLFIGCLWYFFRSLGVI